MTKLLGPGRSTFSVVALVVDGVTQSHLPHTSGQSATLCGLDGDDPALGQFAARAEGEIDCLDCWEIFKVCAAFRASDFTYRIEATND